jgi:hypothetical protein
VRKIVVFVGPAGVCGGEVMMGFNPAPRRLRDELLVEAMHGVVVELGGR